MKFACIYIVNIKSTQIKDICINKYDETCNHLGEFYYSYNEKDKLLSEVKYNAVKRNIAGDINDFLGGISKIVVWDSTDLELLSDIFLITNNRQRYISVIKSSKYNPARGCKLNKTFDKLNLKDNIQNSSVTPVCKFMCSIISQIALTIYSKNNLFITGTSECVSIEPLRNKLCLQTHVPPKNINDTPVKNDIDRETIAKECCNKYGLKYHIDFDKIFINTWLSSWYFNLNDQVITLKHENRRTKIGTNKFEKGYHDQKKTFTDIEKAIKYIFYHDLSQKKRYK